MFNQILDKLNANLSFDIKYRIIELQNVKIGFIFCDFLTDGIKVNDIIFSIINYPVSVVNNENILKHLMSATISKSRKEEIIISAILKGELGLFIDGEQEIILIDVKKYPGRLIGEPDSEKVVRGSRDGFTETLSTNIALVRRRIANPNLIFEIFTIGSSSNTYVVLVYLKDRIDKNILLDVKNKLNKVSTKELTMSDKALEEHLISNVYSPYPLVKYTERPDTFSSHLYQGMFGILVDTSPSAILGPVSIFDHMQHAEEFRQTIISGSYLRFIRFIGIIAGFLLIPIWFAMLRSGFITIDLGVNQVFFQIILIEISIEIVRMASIHTPSALSTSMGLIAGIVIGDMAVNLGIINQKIAFLGFISALSSYITPSYELSLANKIMNLLLVFLVFIFKIYGLIFGLIFLIIYLATLKSFGRSYLYPLVPFNLKSIFKQLFRKPYKE